MPDDLSRELAARFQAIGRFFTGIGNAADAGRLLDPAISSGSCWRAGGWPSCTSRRRRPSPSLCIPFAWRCEHAIASLFPIGKTVVEVEVLRLLPGAGITRTPTV